MQMAKYITKYARTNEFEDAAETVIFWVALRCADSISKGTKKKQFLNQYQTV